MYIGVVALLAEFHCEWDNPDWLAPVELLVSEHHPHLGHLCRNLPQYRDIYLGRSIVQLVLLGFPCVLGIAFYPFELLQPPNHDTLSCGTVSA